MLDIYDKKTRDFIFHRQFSCGNSMVTLYNCPLKSKFQDIWSKSNYIIYVVEGTKVWHTANGSYRLEKNSCVFISKGAAIVEQFFDSEFCLVMFFIPDEFICDVLKSKASPINKPNEKYGPVIPIDNDDNVHAFFHSMMRFFVTGREPDTSLIELKFRELILTIAGNNKNKEMLSYFYALLHEPQSVSLQKVMENNFCFNLKIEEYAQLANRSLSTFKRDFQRQFNTTPGKWLLEKRLRHAHHLLSNTDVTVSEAAFESGFENPSHFSRAFRQFFGVNPVSVKQLIQN